MAKKGKQRQRRGTGGLRKNGDNWEGFYILYREDGTKIVKSFTRATIREIDDIKASLRLLGILDNNVKNIKIDRVTNKITFMYKGQKNSNIKLDNDVLVKDYVDYYLFTHRKNGLNGKKVENTTFATYVDRGNLIKKYIGDRKLKDLTFEDIEDFINELHKETCDSTTRQTRDIVVSLMSYAKKDGVIKENVLQDNKINIKERKGKKEKKIIQREDVETFINYCKEHKYYNLLFILSTGIRASELAGVTWDNIDFEKGTVKIEKAYMRIKRQEYVNGKIVTVRTKGFKDLKSKNSYRTLGLQEGMLKILKQHKEEQKELATSCNKTFKETDWVFTSKSYEGYVSDYSSDLFRNVMEAIKIKNYKELTLHDLRHTYCSLGIMSGVKIEEMKEILGHSNIRSNAEIGIYTWTNKK